MRAKRPLDPEAVKTANEKLWADNSELNGRKLTMSSDTKETGYRKQWMKTYQEALKKNNKKKPPTSGGKKKVDDPSKPCPGCTTADLAVTVTRSNDGAPVAGAKVDINGPESRKGTTDQTGMVTFGGVKPGDYFVIATKDDYLPSPVTPVKVAAGMTTPLTVSITAISELGVTVLDKVSNEPIANANVRITGPAMHERTTDKAGLARFVGIKPGDYDLAVIHSHYHAASDRVTVPAGSTHKEVRLTAEAGLGGVVKDVRTKAPVADAKVEVVGKAGLNTRTDASGIFNFADLGAGDYELRVTKAGYEPATRDVTVAGKTTLRVEIPIAETITVKFSKSATQKYGYDDMDNAAGVPHHVSVKKNDTTTVKVTVGGGATGAEVDFVCDDTSTADVTVPGSPGAVFDLTINGKSKNKAETTLRAKAKGGGRTLASIKVNVYKQKSFSATVVKIYDSSVAATRLSRPRMSMIAAERNINKWYKPPVVKISLSDHSATGNAIDVAYDKNSSGGLELEPATQSDEEKVIRRAFNPPGQKAVIVKELNWIFLLKTAASRGDRTITLKDSYSGHMKFIHNNDVYDLGTGGGKESVTVGSKSGTTITLRSALAKGHPTTHGLMFGLNGLSGNPIYVKERRLSENQVQQVIGHECGHSKVEWKDLTAPKMLMHHSTQTRTDTQVRYKPQPRRHDAGNENQWQTVSRT